MEILITAGGTEEPIDGVRTISNFSTGKTGAVIADEFYKSGHKVTLLTSQRGVTPDEPITIVRYKSFNDLNSNLIDLLGNNKFSGVIHAAAVSDYSVDYLESNGIKLFPNEDLKIDSSKPLSIILKPNIKIINQIKSYSKQPIKLIGFKLTKNGTKEKIKEKVNSLFSSGTVDYVVHNDLTSINNTIHLSDIYKDNKLYKHCTTKSEMAKSLVDIFKEI